MITEDFVSYETAKLLKEKGFDVYVCSFYEKDVYRTKEEFNTNNAFWNWNISGFRYSAPTLQMTMKWLREVHKLFISLQLHMNGSCVWYIYRVDGTPKGCDREPHNYSYEQACEAAIKYCLENLI